MISHENQPYSSVNLSKAELLTGQIVTGLAS